MTLETNIVVSCAVVPLLVVPLLVVPLLVETPVVRCSCSCLNKHVSETNAVQRIERTTDSSTN